MNSRQISCEDSVPQLTEVKWRKRWKSSKGSKRWSCPDVAPNNSSTHAPAEESQVPEGPSPRDSSRPSRFSFLRKSFARSRKESRTLMKHSTTYQFLMIRIQYTGQRKKSALTNMCTRTYIHVYVCTYHYQQTSLHKIPLK